MDRNIMNHCNAKWEWGVGSREWAADPLPTSHFPPPTPRQYTESMAAIKFTLNGKPQTVDAPAQMPLLWVLRDTLGLTGTKFGCGMALCGACTVHINGQPMRVVRDADRDRGGQDRSRPSRDSRPTRSASGAAGVDRGRRAAVRLLPVGPDHDRGRAAGQDPATRPTPISTRRCATTSAAAERIRPSARLSIARPRTRPRRRRRRKERAE